MPATARDWLDAGSDTPDLVVIGAPVSRASISPSEAWSTPPAFREALRRFPLWDAGHGVDVAALRARDAGDIPGDREDGDPAPAQRRIHDAVRRGGATGSVVVVIGGDNSITRPAMQGMMEARPGPWGLLTLDAHHDTRDPVPVASNGTPVRELIMGGLPGKRVAQIGIHPFGNHRDVADWAHGSGVRSYAVADVRRDGMEAVLADALATLARNGAELVYADIDIDVVDRAFTPACPASMPGGLLPGDILAATHLLGRDGRVAAADFCEVDANRDVNGMTVRLMAHAFMSFCSGLTARVTAG